MTAAQKNWLDTHPEYRPFGIVGGRTRYKSTGTLRPDGTFIPASRRAPIFEENGHFGVGILLVPSTIVHV
jgi:hypothetical protein